MGGGAGNPLIVFPLRLASRAISTVLKGLGQARYWVDYRLALARHQSRPDDLFIVSYPKSGTTLLQMLLYQMTTDGSLEFSHIDQVVPWFEVSILRGEERRISALPSPRIFKSHALGGMLPRGSRIIYIARDARDVAVSAWHHDRLMGGMDEFQKYVDAFLQGRGGHGSWFKHIRSWWAYRRDKNFLFLTYEEVTRDLAGTARRVASFAGYPLREEDLPRIVERCSLAFMKQHSRKFDPRYMQLALEGEFIRKGAVGEGAREITPGQVAAFVRKYEELTRDLRV